MINITLKDGNVIELEKGSTVKDAAFAISSASAELPWQEGSTGSV